MRRRHRPARRPRTPSSSSSCWPTLRAAETQLERAAQGGQGRQVAGRRGRRAGAGRGLLSTGTPLYRADLSPTTSALLRPFFLLTTKPVLAVVNLGEDQLDDADASSRRCAPSSAASAEVLGGVRPARGRGRAARRRRAGRAARGPRAGRGRAAPRRPRRVPPARAAHVPHHRRQGVPGVDVPGRREGAASARASSTPTSSAGSSAPRSSTGTSCSRSGRGPRPRRSASSGSRARTTRSHDGDVLEIRFNV